jgi:hypothetical protein
MPFHFERVFTRQGMAVPSQFGLVIPASAELSAGLSEEVRRDVEALGPPTMMPSKIAYHYVAWPPDQSLLSDQAEVDTGIYTFKVKDAVMGVFDLARWANDEFCWSFASNAQRDVLAALRIGQTFDVQFEEPLDEAFHVLQYHFAPEATNSGYGEYGVHLAVDPPRTDGLRIVSSFEPHSKRTDSRLPFFFGFRVFGMAVGTERQPIWRELLAAAVRQAAHRRWAHCLLYAAFSLESFIDRQLADRLELSGFGQKHIAHILQVKTRKEKLFALNNVKERMPKKGLNICLDGLNKEVFTPRNRLAHGKKDDREISADQAVAALKATVEFMWEWDDTSRLLLLAPMRGSFEGMIDNALLEACANGVG